MRDTALTDTTTLATNATAIASIEAVSPAGLAPRLTVAPAAPFVPVFDLLAVLDDLAEAVASLERVLDADG
ncbi:MAG: hypothetical protein JWN72_8 [Thermoleophilia bacterium]|nr:hypothetical protein [Thermoleophilia bacterium]